MKLRDLFRRGQQAEVLTQKSVSLPEVLYLISRGRSQTQDWDIETAIKQGLKASAIFYACCRIRAEAFSQVAWIVKTRSSNGEMKPAPSHPLNRLIDRPNPDFSFAEMMELASYHIDLAGNAYWSGTRAGTGNLIRELWPLYPQGISIQPGAQRLIEKYIYKRGTAKREILAEDMIHIKTANPADFLFGLPTIQAAGRAVDVDREAGIWQSTSLQNRGVSDYAIMIDPMTTQEQIDRLRQLHRERQGGSDNARAPLLSTRDIKVLNQSAVEMDFINSRTKTWEEISSAMGVPLPMIGVLENATLANINESRRIFWLDTIIPLLRKVRSQLNQQLASEYGVYLDYDLSNVEALREDYKQKLEEATKLFSMGVPFNLIDEKLELGIGEIEGGDVGYLSSGLIPSDDSLRDLSGGEPLRNSE